MIKVTIKSHGYNKEAKIWENTHEVKEHKDGAKASVYNGVLSIFPEGTAVGETTSLNAIAGYMPDRWLDWEKA